MADGVPESARSQLEICWRIEGNTIILYEHRARVGRIDEWHDKNVARFSYVSTRDVWRLFHQMSDLKWHAYWGEPKEATQFSALFEEVKRDPTHIFWG